jgi:hypothetical protein
MIGVSIHARRRAFALLSAALILVATASAQSTAGASSGLSSVVLADTVPGLVAAPPGARNGPIDQSNLALVLGGSNQAVLSQFAQQLASGDVSGFIRTWAHQPANGDAVEITAFQFQDPTQAASFLNGEEGSVSQLTGVGSFAVPNIPGAAGYILHGSASGTPYTEYVAVFAKANIDLNVTVLTASGDLGAADATHLAGQQWANVPTPVDWARVVGLAVGLGLLVLSVVIVLVARNRRYPPAFAAPAFPASPGPWAPPVPPPPRPA